MAAGGIPDEAGPDAVLVVHAPDPAGGDRAASSRRRRPPNRSRTVATLRAALARGVPVGSVVAALMSTVVGQRRGTSDPVAARRLLLHRLIEDWGYQTVVRTRLVREHGLGYNVGGPGAWSPVEYVARAERELARVLADLDPAAAAGGLMLPWQRSFEVDFEVTVG